MRWLVGCEYSGRVRDALIARGHEAVSVDLIPSLSKGPHIIADVRDIISEKFDGAIFFPPCQYLTVVANRYQQTWRMKERDNAVRFVEYLWEAPIARLAIENPVGVLSTRFRRPSQYIHPCSFGDPYWKKTGIWIRGLPLLQPTRYVRASAVPWVSGQTGKPGAANGDLRSLTFQGIADAMAEQWGSYE